LLKSVREKTDTEDRVPAYKFDEKLESAKPVTKLLEQENR
jgi:hypothetical protein